MKKRVIPRTKRGQISVVATFIALLFACSAEIKAIYSEVPHNDQNTAFEIRSELDRNATSTNDKAVEIRCEDDQTMLLFLPDNNDSISELSEKLTIQNVSISLSDLESGKMLTISVNTEPEKVAGSEAQPQSTRPLTTGYLSSLCS